MTVLTASHMQRDEAGEMRIAEIELEFSSGKPRALEAAFAEFNKLVYSLSLRSVDETAAADIVQEVFVAAWRSHDRYDANQGGLAPWLVGIARNKIIDHHRANNREVRRVDRLKANRQDFHHELEDVGLRMLLVDAINSLPLRAQSIISLAFFDQLTHVEIAAQTGFPLGTVKSDIKRSLERLRRGLEYNDE